MPNVHFAAARKVGNFLFSFGVRIKPQTTHAVRPVLALSLARHSNIRRNPPRLIFAE
jgi:hypothetical protein